MESEGRANQRMKVTGKTEGCALFVRLQEITSADAADHLRALGVHRTVMRGLRAMTSTGSVVGRARTLRILPDREDIKAPVNGPANRGLYDSLNDGEILVVDAMGREDKAVLGDMMFSRIAARQAIAALVDGAVRDVAHVDRKRFPVFARALCPDSYMGWLRPWERDVPVQCGGVLVMPGDWIIADADGQVVVPASMVEELVDKATEKARLDAFSQALLEEGYPLDDAYPLPAHMKLFLEAFSLTGALPTPEQVSQAYIKN